ASYGTLAKGLQARPAPETCPRTARPARQPVSGTFQKDHFRPGNGILTLRPPGVGIAPCFHRTGRVMADYIAFVERYPSLQTGLALAALILTALAVNFAVRALLLRGFNQLLSLTS